jgi:hypothetical protein
MADCPMSIEATRALSPMSFHFNKFFKPGCFCSSWLIITAAACNRSSSAAPWARCNFTNSRAP